MRTKTKKEIIQIGLIADAIQVIRDKEEDKVLFFGYPTLLKTVKTAVQELNNHLTSRCRSIDKMNITGRQAFRLETHDDPFKSFLREWYSEGQDPCGWIMRLQPRKLAEILLKHNFIA